MAKPPIRRSGNHPRRVGVTEQGPVMGRGTKITSLPTKELLARDREVEQIDMSQHSGGSGNLIYDQPNLWFIRSPIVPERFSTHIDVRATVGVSSEFDPQESDNYFGIWPAAATPTDADVKAGTGALAHTSLLGVPHGTQIDHRFLDPPVTVGEQYALHWLAEHTGEAIYIRWTGPTYFIVENSAPLGFPVIIGTPQVGEVLTADTSGISDPDGLTSPGWTYQWKRGGANIPGATGSTYTLTDDDKGQLISVCVSFTDDQGTDEMLCSSAVGPVAAINYPATGKPAITGTVREGQLLSATIGTIEDLNGIDAGAILGFTWRRDGTTVIPGATQETYLLQEEDVGSTIQVGIAFTDNDGFSEGPLYSDETSVVLPYNRPATGKPAISGTVLEGEILQGEAGTVADYNGVPDIGTWTWEWRRDGSPIAGATSRTYTLQAADVGAKISVACYFTDLAGFNEGPLVSDETIYVPELNHPATGAPDITGTVFEGSTLTAGPGTVADENGLPDISLWTWQWRRGTTPIPDAVSRTYVIQAADVGSTLSVCASFTDLAGYDEGPLCSADTIVVPGSNQPPTGIPVITGTVLEGEIISCDTTGISDPDGIDQGSWTYQWQRDQVDLPGQMAQDYTITGNDVGSRLRVYVYFDDLGGTHEGPLYSAETIVVVRYNRPAEGIPAITGTAEVDQVLTSTWGNVSDANGLPSIGDWVWYADGVEVHSETDVASSTYTVSVEVQDKAITVGLSFTDQDGYAEGELLSDPTAVVPIAEYFHDFSSDDLQGPWTHIRGSKATMHDYLGHIVTVEGDDANDPALVGTEYTDPDTYVDHGVGYGVQLEDESTNDLLHSNDLSNVVWTLTNATLATDVVTATAANGTITQTVTAASGANTFSVYVYPVTVTGAIEISAGNGVWVAVTPGEVTRFAATQTATNPVVGVRIVNSGDAVRVRYAQLEVGQDFATSYIATAGTPVTRAATNLSAPFSALPPLPAEGVVNDWCGQIIFRLRNDWAATPNWGELFSLYFDSGTNDYLQIGTDASNNIYVGSRANNSIIINDTRSYAGQAGDILDLRFRKTSQASNGFVLWIDGVKENIALSAVESYANALVNIAVGHKRGGSNYVNVEHIRTRIVPSALTDQEIEAWEGWTCPSPVITKQPDPLDFGGDVPPVGTVQNSLVSIQWMPAWEYPDGLTGGTDAVMTAPVSGSSYKWEVETGFGTGVWTGASSKLTLVGDSVSQNLTVRPSSAVEMCRVRCVTDGVPSLPGYLSIFEELEPRGAARQNELSEVIGNLIFHCTTDYYYYAWDRPTNGLLNNKAPAHSGPVTEIDSVGSVTWRRFESRIAAARAIRVEPTQTAGYVTYQPTAENYATGLTVATSEIPDGPTVSGTVLAIATSGQIKARIGYVNGNYGVSVDGGALQDTGVKADLHEVNMVSLTIDASGGVTFYHVNESLLVHSKVTMGTSAITDDIAHVAFMNNPLTNTDPLRGAIGTMTAFSKALNEVEMFHTLRTLFYRVRRGYWGYNKAISNRP